MNGLFGKLQMSPPQAVHPDVAAAMGQEMGTPPITPPPQPVPQAMDPQQAEIEAMNALAAQQQKPKYSVGVPQLDKYINMFLGQ